MMKVHVLFKCEHCRGEAYVPTEEAEDYRGNKYMRHQACPHCQGSGNQSKWIDLKEFAVLLKQTVCTHEHVSSSGNFHLVAGEVWDDIEETCSDCGMSMR